MTNSGACFSYWVFIFSLMKKQNKKIKASVHFFYVKFTEARFYEGRD